VNRVRARAAGPPTARDNHMQGDMSMPIGRRSFLLGASATLGAAISAPPASAAVQFNLSDVLPEGNYQVQCAKRFAEQVERATSGEVQIVVRPGGSLGFRGPEQMRAVRDGLVPMANVLTSQQIGDEPMFGTEGIPFLVGSQEDLLVLHRFLRPEFDRLAARFNQKILYMLPSPSQYLFLKIRASSLEQLRGVKIRGADRNTVDITNAIGMAGVIIPWGELIPALASGRVDGVATSATSAVDGRFWEFLRYVYATNHTWGSNMVNVNLSAWGRISPGHQRAIEELAASLQPEFWNVATRSDAESIQRLTANGMEVVEIPSAMMADIRRQAAPLRDAYLQRVPAAEPIVRQYLAALGRS
jgi:TRAP-type C4-dicarboxylate transport system substrate-binding protein